MNHVTTRCGKKAHRPAEKNPSSAALHGTDNSPAAAAPDQRQLINAWRLYILDRRA